MCPCFCVCVGPYLRVQLHSEERKRLLRMHNTLQNDINLLTTQISMETRLEIRFKMSPLIYLLLSVAHELPI